MHFYGLIFTPAAKGEYGDICDILAKYDEQNENYYEYVDCTDEVRQRWDLLPEHKDKEHAWEASRDEYPTIDDLASDYYGYEKRCGRYYDVFNPNAHFDWFEIGGWWCDAISTKDGRECPRTLLDNVDWDNTQEPFFYVDAVGQWNETQDEGSGFKEYVKSLLALDEGTRKEIAVSVIDAHI